jgi:hypothetical protein
LHAYTVSIGEMTLSTLIQRMNQLAPVVLSYEKQHAVHAQGVLS